MAVRIDPEGSETRAMRSLIDFRGKAVVEVGCGDGRLTWRYADDAARVVGLDPLARDISVARATTPKQLKSTVRFVETDAVTYRYSKASFDVAILSYSL